MTLTVTEKEHWKVRIGRKISQAIADLVEQEDPGYLTRISNEARLAAVKSLGIAELLAREETLDNQKKQLDQDKDDVRRLIVATLRKVAPDQVKSESYYHSSNSERECAIRARQEAEERRLMVMSPLGAIILKLRREEEELLDTVWLATSPKQIRHLWAGVAELVSAEPTTLQKQAMKVDDSLTET